MRPTSKKEYYLFDYSKKEIWELCFHKSENKTQITANFAPTIREIKPENKKIIFEGDFVYPYWTWDIEIVKERYHKDIVQLGIKLPVFKKTNEFRRISLPENKLSNEVFSLFDRFWRTCLYLNQGFYYVEVIEQSKTHEIRKFVNKYEEVIVYEDQPEGLSFMIYQNNNDYRNWFELSFITKAFNEFLKEQQIRL